MSNDRYHDTTMSYLHTAAQVHRDTHQRQLHQLAQSADAEDRAFYAERAQQLAEADLRHERAEHHLTKLAMQRLLATNIGLERTVADLAARWAPHDGKRADELQADIAAAAVARANTIAAHPENADKLKRGVEARREAERAASTLPVSLRGL